MQTNFLEVTELAGDKVTKAQVIRLCNRYYWAGHYCRGKNVIEAACGTGQGLGYLQSISRTLRGGDYSEPIVGIARQHYGDRLSVERFDAQAMPVDNQSADLVILFEAIYYLPDAEKFVGECARILRPGGMVLICSANKDLYDFNPSPHTYKYYGVVELGALVARHGFTAEFFGDTPVAAAGSREKALRWAKATAVRLGLMPKTMSGKKLLKRLVFGGLVDMPREIDAATAPVVTPKRIPGDQPCRDYKVVYCAARLPA